MATCVTMVSVAAMVTARAARRGAAVLATVAIAGTATACASMAARPPAAAVLADHPRGLTSPWQVRGRLLADPLPLGNAWRVDLGVESIRVDRVWRPWPLRVRTTVYDARTIVAWAADDGFEAFLRLRPRRLARNPLVTPGAPLAASGADVLSSLKSFRQLRRREPARRFARLASATRTAVRDTIAHRFGDDAPLVNALLLGERGEVPAKLTQVLARTGLIHLIAISGLHVGIVVTALFALLRAVGLARVHAALGCALALPLLYALVVPRPPVARACLMALVLLLGIASGRRGAAINALAAATLALTVADPWTVRNIGFQLSSAATAAIILAVGSRQWSRRLIARLVAVPLAVSCAALLGVASILASTTYRLPLASAPVNIVAVPLLVVALISALLTLAADTLGAGALAVLSGSASLTAMDLLRRLAFALDAHSAAIGIPAPAVLWTALACAATLALPVVSGTLSTSASGRRYRPLRAALAATALLLCAAAVVVARTPPLPPIEAFRMVAFDVGQGDALLVETNAGAIMIDTGGSPGSDFDPGTALLAPALRARGITHLDAVAITHLHADHVGGLAGLRAEIPVHAVWTTRFVPSEAIAAHSRGAAGMMATRSLAAGDRRDDGACTWYTIHPPAPATNPARAGGGAANDASLVLSLSCNGRWLLLTGDTEGPAEALYANHPSLRRGSVLKAPHHGSRTSSSEPLLDALAPRHVVISAGWRNRFGLPNGDVLERYRARQVAVYRTDRDGAITVSAGARIRVSGERWAAGRGRYVVGGWLY